MHLDRRAKCEGMRSRTDIRSTQVGFDSGVGSMHVVPCRIERDASVCGDENELGFRAGVCGGYADRVGAEGGEEAIAIVEDVGARVGVDAGPDASVVKGFESVRPKLAVNVVCVGRDKTGVKLFSGGEHKRGEGRGDVGAGVCDGGDDAWFEGF